MASTTMTPPISYTRLKQIANDACESALATAEGYEHSKTEGWNTSIINSILRSLISESSSPSQPPSYKYAVNSTIIQHLSAASPSSHPHRPNNYASTSTSTSTAPGANEASTADETHPVAGGPSDERASPAIKSEAGTANSGHHPGRRGMHSATGAYWNNEKDGMWSFKYETGEAKGMDVVISVIWISI